MDAPPRLLGEGRTCLVCQHRGNLPTAVPTLIPSQSPQTLAFIAKEAVQNGNLIPLQGRYGADDQA